MVRPLLPLLPAILISLFSAEATPILNQRGLLEAQTFWDNRDFDWFEKNIPFLDSPDPEINTTYYYRWELVSKRRPRNPRAVQRTPSSSHLLNQKSFG